jgi:hypothetical protein
MRAGAGNYRGERESPERHVLFRGYLTLANTRRGSARTIRRCRCGEGIRDDVVPMNRYALELAVSTRKSCEQARR